MSDANHDVEGLYDGDEENCFDEELMEELWERRTDATEMREEIKKLRSQRDEISIHADVIIKEASALITRCVESRKASAYWNAVEQFRQFESRTT